ncbi:MAG TPA: hypothetical protein VH280_19220 [Verrucomicrobiae bacterium]|jgi:uncharacterized membrane-anchored protein YitT (DUF2179 family)|nr:hypothetical protein [Verrucomicrobiae bacterium]
MRNPILGFSSALAFLFVGYAGAWFGNPDEIQFLSRTPDAFGHAFEALILAAFFAAAIMVIIVWPQTSLASWLVRRFRLHRFFPFPFFFVICSIVVCILDFTVIRNHRLIMYLIGTSYLFVSCLIFWWISFRHVRHMPNLRG